MAAGLLTRAPHQAVVAAQQVRQERDSGRAGRADQGEGGDDDGGHDFLSCRTDQMMRWMVRAPNLGTRPVAEQRPQGRVRARPLSQWRAKTTRSPWQRPQERVGSASATST